MIRTRVGYAGGQKSSPNYSNLGDHTETVQIDYDPVRITYDKLLDIFWDSHQPARQSHSRQYKNAVFFHNDRHRRLAMASKTALERTMGKPVKSEIVPLVSFTMAEKYHQKYLLKHHVLNKELMRIYPRHEDFVNSTAAARLNGYVGRYGSREQVLQEIDSLGLSDKGKTVLIELFPN